MATIYLSYRREDAGAYAIRLRDHLVKRLPNDVTVVDIDSRLGGEFVQIIASEGSSADVMLVLIDPRWASAHDDSGRRLIDDHLDFVRREIAAAFSVGAWVIPVLVGGGQLPPARDLPEGIQSLTRRLCVELREASWEADVSDLIDLLSKSKNATFRTQYGGESREPLPSPDQATAAASPRPSESKDRSEGRDLFISYAEEDSSTVSGFIKELHSVGLTTWSYEEDAVPGTSYLAQAYRAIQTCRAFVVIASVHSIHSRQVVKEVGVAHDQDKMIIPVRVGLTHQQSSDADPVLQMATGTLVSSSLDDRGAAEIAKRIANALRLAGRQERT